MRTLLLVISLWISLPCFAKGEAQIARFEPWFEPLSTLLKTKDADQAAGALLEEEARVPAFNLQALGRVYEDEDKAFGDLRDDFKKLEDAIGGYEKFKKILKKVSDEKKKEELEEAMAEAKKDLVKLLEKKDWLGKKSRLAEWREFISEYDWDGYDKDKRVALKSLVRDLKKLDETDFDLSILEEGDGLHELRRQVRWFAIEARVLNGLIQFRADKKDCPSKAFARLVDSPVSKSKYAELPKGPLEISPCLISQCLFLSFSKIIEELGDLKDEAEVAVQVAGTVEEDRVPEAIRKKAQKLYDGVKDNELVPLMVDQLKACY